MLKYKWDGDMSNPMDIESSVPRSKADYGNSDNWPFLFKVAVLAASILAGKTPAQAKAAVRQAYNILK